MPPEALNLLVFRADRRSVDGRKLKSELRRRLEELRHGASLCAVEMALLLAGEFECAVADVDELLARSHSELTDRLAEKLVTPHAPLDVAALTGSLSRCPAPETLSVSPPEGFAYYALHPLAYVEVLESVLTKPVAPGERIAIV